MLPVMTFFRLEGRLALVTGTSRGLGLMVAGALARPGAHVVLATCEGAALSAAIDELSGRGLSEGSMVADVADDQCSTRSLSTASAIRPTS